MNKPIYAPPKLKSEFKTINDKIVARLKTARMAPVIEIQFLIDEGNFMLFFLTKTNLIAPQVCKKMVIIQQTRVI